MLSLRRIATLPLLTPISQAVPHHNKTNTLGEVLHELSPKPNQLAINKRDTTDYRTMPPGTYTETISTSLIRIIIVNDPTPTLCPAECDCSGIKDKESPEYFQCLTSSRCRPCREPAITASSTTAKPTATCPPYCDCTKVKDKQSEEYFQCLTNANCQKCRIGGPPSIV